MELDLTIFRHSRYIILSVSICPQLISGDGGSGSPAMRSPHPFVHLILPLKADIEC
jgi:hypothetical protein